MRVISILSKSGLLIEQDEGIYFISFHKVEEKFKYHINGFVSLPIALEALLVKIWDDINEFERAEIRRVFIGLGNS